MTPEETKFEKLAYRLANTYANDERAHLEAAILVQLEQAWKDGFEAGAKAKGEQVLDAIRDMKL